MSDVTLLKEGSEQTVSDMINDVKYIKHLNEKLGKHYHMAKALFVEDPISSLAQLRTCLELLCHLITDTANVKLKKQNDLCSHIFEIDNTNLLPAHDIKTLHVIRQATNKGIHHTNYVEFKEKDWSRLAQSTLLQFCKMAEVVGQRYLLQDKVAYEYIQPKAAYFSMKDICFEAVMNDDSLALYYLGAHFMTLHEKMLTEMNVNSKDKSMEYLKALYERDKKILAKTNYYFTLAADKEPKAQLELARFTAAGIFGKADVVSAFMTYKHLADNGNLDAMFYYGKDYDEPRIMEQLDVNSDEVFQYLLKAADRGHVTASFRIAHYYIQQAPMEIIEQRDVRKVFKYAYYAAQRDDQDALYLLGLLYADNSLPHIDCVDENITKHQLSSKREILEYYFRLSYEHGSFVAGIELAEFMVENKDTRKEGFDLFNHCVVVLFNDDSLVAEESLFRLACRELEYFRHSGAVSLSNIFMKTKDNSLREMIAYKCRQLIPIAREKLLNMTYTQKEKYQKFASAVFIMFHDNGVPKTASEMEETLSGNNETVDKLVKTMLNYQPKPKEYVAVSSKDRNKPCDCGSGKKYKKCCALKPQG